MDIRLLPIDELDEPQVGRWRELARRAVEPNPFFEPEFLLPAAEAAGASRPHLVVAEEGAAWVGCLPVAQARWRRALPVWRTWRGMYGYLGTPLVADDRAEAATALLEGLSGAAGGRALLLDWLTGDGPSAQAITGAGTSRHELRETRRFQRALLVRRDDGDYLGHMKSHHLREARRLARRLGDEVGELSIADRAGSEAAVDSFLEIELKGWKGRSETAMASKEADTRFFREVCARFAAQGRLQLLELRAGSRTIAMKCNLIADVGSFAFKIAFDDECARFSPGIQLELANIDEFHASGLEWMDSCADQDNAMINRLWTGRRELESLLFVRAGTFGRAAYGTLKTAIAISGKD